MKHGGKRERAGKPAQYSEPMVKVDFMLPKEAIKFYTLLGNGNRSEGARRAWRSLTKRAADGAECVCENHTDNDGWRCNVCGLLSPHRR